MWWFSDFVTTDKLFSTYFPRRFHSDRAPSLVGGPDPRSPFPALRERKGNTSLSNYSRIPLHLFPALTFISPKMIFPLMVLTLRHLSLLLRDTASLKGE